MNALRHNKVEMVQRRRHEKSYIAILEKGKALAPESVKAGMRGVLGRSDRQHLPAAKPHVRDSKQLWRCSHRCGVQFQNRIAKTQPRQMSLNEGLDQFTSWERRYGQAGELPLGLPLVVPVNRVTQAVAADLLEFRLSLYRTTLESLGSLSISFSAESLISSL